MELIVFEKESYYKMMEEVMSLMYKIIREAKADAIKSAGKDDDLISTEEAYTLLGLKSRHRLLELRKEKIIRGFQHGRRVLYSKQDILNYIYDQKIED